MTTYVVDPHIPAFYVAGGYTSKITTSFVPSSVNSASPEIVYYETPSGVGLLSASLPPPLRWGVSNAVGTGF